MYSGKSLLYLAIENKNNEIAKLLIEKGVNENLVSAVGMGESTIDPSDEGLMQKIVLDGEEFKWNRNMRVEIKIVK